MLRQWNLYIVHIPICEAGGGVVAGRKVLIGGVRLPESALSKEEANRRSRYLSCRSGIVCEERRVHTRLKDYPPGATSGLVPACAL